MRARGIKAGDVVQVIRDCCGTYVGMVYVVRTIEFLAEPTFVHCAHCGWGASTVTVAHNDRASRSLPALAPVAWLKRFEPPAEPASEVERLYRPKLACEGEKVAR